MRALLCVVALAACEDHDAPASAPDLAQCGFLVCCPDDAWQGMSRCDTEGEHCINSISRCVCTNRLWSCTSNALLNGCNGLLACADMCQQARACIDDCEAGATQRGLDLFAALQSCGALDLGGCQAAMDTCLADQP